MFASSRTEMNFLVSMSIYSKLVKSSCTFSIFIFTIASEFIRTEKSLNVIIIIIIIIITIIIYLAVCWVTFACKCWGSLTHQISVSLSLFSQISHASKSLRAMWFGLNESRQWDLNQKSLLIHRMLKYAESPEQGWRFLVILIFFNLKGKHEMSWVEKRWDCSKVYMINWLALLLLINLFSFF